MTLKEARLMRAGQQPAETALAVVGSHNGDLTKEKSKMKSLKSIAGFCLLALVVNTPILSLIWGL